MNIVMNLSRIYVDLDDASHPADHQKECHFKALLHWHQSFIYSYLAGK